MRAGVLFLPAALATAPSGEGMAFMVPYPDYAGDLKVWGQAGIELTGANATNLHIAYQFSGVDHLCNQTPPAGVANACGLHIHEGTNCDDAATVGGHYYDKSKYTSDPWADKVYKSRIGGDALGEFSVDCGYTKAEVEGRAMVVHDHTGARVACGIVGKQPPPEPIKLGAYPGHTGKPHVSGNVGVFDVTGPNGEAGLRVVHRLETLEKECWKAPAGVANACGIHIHEGTNCDDADQVGGHYYDHAKYDADPWANKVYHTHTEPGGMEVENWSRGENTVYCGYNLAAVTGRTVVIHDKTGARVACGVVAPAP